MTNLVFKSAEAFSVGVELEIQILNCDNHDLLPSAGFLLEQIAGSKYEKHIKPEITQSMIEINSSPHRTVQPLYDELLEIRDFLLEKAHQLNMGLSGGGTHPFQLWNEREIFCDPKFKLAAHKYGYLAKLFTVFGLHIHVGCKTSTEMIYLLNTLPRYMPQLIALSASSPFCQGIDTDFESCRMNVVNSFPLHGISPIVEDWNEFNDYIAQLKNLHIIKNIDNLYWDIRPRPEIGTVEIRICDMPLSVRKVALLTAYVQALAYYLIVEKPTNPLPYNEYHLYQYNRFQACRHGFGGQYIHFYNHQRTTIKKDILDSFECVESYAKKFSSIPFIFELMQDVGNEENDAKLLRSIYQQKKSMTDIVKFQIQQFTNECTQHSIKNFLTPEMSVDMIKNEII